MRCFCHFGGGLHSTVNAAADEDEVDHLKTGTIISCDVRYFFILAQSSSRIASETSYP